MFRFDGHRWCGGQAGVYRPTDIGGVGGDYFAAIPLPGEWLALAVGDVVGHGLAVAATMGRMRMAVQMLAALDLPPEEILARLRDLVVRLGQEDREPATAGTLGSTCLVAVYDPVDGACAVASAGQPPPAVVRRGGSVE